MNRVEWPSLARVLAWILAAAFVLSAVILAILVFVPIGTPPEQREDFIEQILADFEHEQQLWPLDFVGSALLALGFAALGGLGVAIGRLADPDDGRRGLVSGAFLLAGGLGAASQLIYIGVIPTATNPEYCECGLLAEEIMSRLMILDVTGAALTWLLNGAVVAAAVGLLAGGALGREAGMPEGWRWLSLGTAALAIVVGILSTLRLYPVDVILTVVVVGIVIPVWAVWLAIRARTIWPSTPQLDEVTAGDG